MNKALLLALLAGTVAPAAASEESTVLQFTMQGYAGQFQEHCMQMETGQALTFSLRSPFSVRVNVHHHEDGGTTILVDELIENTREKAVTAPVDGGYCFEVRNTENRPSPFELQLEYRLGSD